MEEQEREKIKAINLFLFEIETSFNVGIECMSHIETILPLFYDVAFKAGYHASFTQSKQVVKLRYNEILEMYPSANIAARVNGLSSSTVIGNCNGKHKFTKEKGVRYMYLKDYDEQIKKAGSANSLSGFLPT